MARDYAGFSILERYERSIHLLVGVRWRGASRQSGRHHLRCRPRCLPCPGQVQPGGLRDLREVERRGDGWRDHDQGLLDFEKIARTAIREIGYVNDDDVFHADKVFVNMLVTQQSPDIAQGVDARKATGKKTPSRAPATRA